MPILVAQLKNDILARFPNATIADVNRNNLRHFLGKSAEGRDRFALDSSIGSYHYLDAGSWREINTDWLDSTSGWADENDRHAFRCLSDANGKRRIYPDRSDPNAYVEFARPQRWTGSAWQNITLPARTRTADSLLWDAAAFAINIQNTGDQIKLSVTLKNATAARRIRWPVTLTGLTFNNWQLLKGGVPVIRVPRPTLVDANGVERTVASDYVNGAVEFTADVSGLTYPIVIDPTIDVQVGASEDDGRRFTGTNDFLATATTPYVGWQGSQSTILSAHGWARFTGLSGLSGATIDVSYLSLCANLAGSNNTSSIYIYCNDTASPVAPTNSAEFDALALTTAYYHYQVNSIAWVGGTFYDTGSINAPIQEIATSYDPAVIQVVMLNQILAGQDNRIQIRQYDYAGNLSGPKLHIEYTAGGATVKPWYYYAQQ